MSAATFVPVREIDQGGQGVPIPLYLMTCKGEVLRVCKKAGEALEWLRHPYHQSHHYACYSLIDGVQREVIRNR